MRNLITALIFALTTGCGGTDEILTSELGTHSGGGSPNSAMSAGTWILDAFARPLSTSDAIPTGTATYQGIAIFGTDTEDSLTLAQNPSFKSSVTVNASLQHGILNANFTNFSNGSGSPIEGNIQSSLTSTNGIILGTASGNLNLPNGIIEYSGDISGQFRGQGANFFTGDLQLAGNAGELTGIFATQR